MSFTHKNKVIIESSCIDRIGITHDFSLTSGQPYNPPIRVTMTAGKKDKPDKWEIVVDCGRKGSTAVANQFKTWCGDDVSHMFGIKVLVDSMPDELNFAFGVIIYFKGEPPLPPVADLYFGQGHVPVIAENNWWVGSLSIQNSSSGATINTWNGHYTLGSPRIDVDHNIFTIIKSI